MSIDDRLETAHAVLGVALSMLGRADDADASIRTALALNPNSATCRHSAGLAQFPRSSPDWKAMIAHGEAALALSPMDPVAHAFQHIVTIGHLIGKRDHSDPGFVASARAAARHRGAAWYVHLLAAIAEAAVDDDEAARREIAKALRLAPGTTMKKYRKAFDYPCVENLYKIGDDNGINARIVGLGLPME